MASPVPSTLGHASMYNSTIAGKQVVLQSVDNNGSFVQPEKVTVQGMAYQDARSSLQMYTILLFVALGLIGVCVTYGIYQLATGAPQFSLVQGVFLVVFAGIFVSYNYYSLGLVNATGVEDTFVSHDGGWHSDNSGSSWHSDKSGSSGSGSGSGSAGSDSTRRGGGEDVSSIFYAPLYVCISIVMFVLLFIALCLFFALYTAAFFLAVILVGLCHFFYILHVA